MNLHGVGLRSRRGSTACILAGVRLRLARWISPAGAGALRPEAPSPRTADLLRLAEAFVRHHGFAELTHQNTLEILGKYINPGDYYAEKWKFVGTITRLLKHPSVCPRPATYHRVMNVFSDHWPADLPWPSDIPRPPPQ